MSKFIDELPGVYVCFEDMQEFMAQSDRIQELNKRSKELEDRLFKLGEMEKPPCFCCGYNGPNYYQPDVHPCAERHHRLKESDNE